MGEIEARMELAVARDARAVSGGQLLALVDTLRTGTLNDDQKQTVLALRTGIMAFVTQGAPRIWGVDDSPQSGHGAKADGQVSMRLRGCQPAPDSPVVP